MLFGLGVIGGLPHLGLPGLSLPGVNLPGVNIPGINGGINVDGDLDTSPMMVNGV